MELTEKQGYMAMYYYLEKLYEQTKSEDLGGFLGEMRLLADGFPADNAIWNDWLVAVNKVKL
jgi:hypothetical protein